jgi:hypothetical protein
MLSGISPESFSDIKAGMSSDIFSGMQNPAYLLAVFCRSIWYTLWLFNSSPWKIAHRNRCFTY